jgi:hypothetical protein
VVWVYVPGATCVEVEAELVVWVSQLLPLRLTADTGNGGWLVALGGRAGGLDACRGQHSQAGNIILVQVLSLNQKRA